MGLSLVILVFDSLHYLIPNLDEKLANRSFVVTVGLVTECVSLFFWEVVLACIRYTFLSRERSGGHFKSIIANCDSSSPTQILCGPGSRKHAFKKSKEKQTRYTKNLPKKGAGYKKKQHILLQKHRTIQRIHPSKFPVPDRGVVILIRILGLHERNGLLQLIEVLL